MAKRFHKSGSGAYEGMDSRRSQESADFNMMGLDSSSVANMPQNVVYKAWPSAGNYSDYGLNDTIGGVNKQMNEDGAKMKKHLQPGKY